MPRPQISAIERHAECLGQLLVVGRGLVQTHEGPGRDVRQDGVIAHPVFGLGRAAQVVKTARDQVDRRGRRKGDQVQQQDEQLEREKCLY